MDTATPTTPLTFPARYQHHWMPAQSFAGDRVPVTFMTDGGALYTGTLTPTELTLWSWRLGLTFTLPRAQVAVTGAKVVPVNHCGWTHGVRTTVDFADLAGGEPSMPVKGYLRAD